MTQSDQDIIKLLEKTKQRSKDTRRFKNFRELSFSTVFSKLDTVKKIKESVYYKVLNNEITSKTSDNIESLQELLKVNYSVQDTLMSFVLEQLKTFMYIDSTILEKNKELAENIENAHHHINSGEGEKTLIKHIMYFLLFLYFHEFEIKPFIPVFIERYDMYKGKYNAKQAIQKAFTFSKLYYLKHKKYLPVIIIIDLSDKCSHAVNFICIPSQKKRHQFDNIIVDTSGITEQDEICEQDLSEVINEVTIGFDMFSILFKKNHVLNEIFDDCVNNLQGDYGTCVNYSLGVTLNYLFQEDHSTSILQVCKSLNEKNINVLNHILITIGNVSHLFHKFIRQVILKKVEKRYNKILKIRDDNFQVIKEIYENNQGDIDSEFQIPKLEAGVFRDQNNMKKFNDAIDKIYHKIITILQNLNKNDKKTLKKISNFLKECGKVIYKWDMINININEI